MQSDAAGDPCTTTTEAVTAASTVGGMNLRRRHAGRGDGDGTGGYNGAIVQRRDAQMQTREKGWEMDKGWAVKACQTVDMSNSLFFFDTHHGLRVFCYWLVTRDWFEHLVLIAVMVMSLAFALSDPSLPEAMLTLLDSVQVRVLPEAPAAVLFTFSLTERCSAELIERCSGGVEDPRAC